MKILYHHIYEYKKGLRSLVLHTLASEYLHEAECRLKRNDISYIVHRVNETKANIFFGDRNCVAVVASFGEKSLYDLTPEEDFILGIMLGYSRIEQCRRYIKRSRLDSSERNRATIHGTVALRSVSA
ncbi:DUF2023 family protein [Marispirochaeta aestuarii]|uniref:DUF2023 family protein n=1 Tax=Marispirochaeta aestuarii TaxID=1963862 RepID=UPI0029C8D6BC|nr:DUF2023 family protein [Marispirochaeta aestuarii]